MPKRSNCKRCGRPYLKFHNRLFCSTYCSEENRRAYQRRYSRRRRNGEDEQEKPETVAVLLAKSYIQPRTHHRCGTCGARPHKEKLLLCVGDNVYCGRECFKGRMTNDMFRAQRTMWSTDHLPDSA